MTVYTPEIIKKIIWEKSVIWFTGIFIPRCVFDEVGKFPSHEKLSEDFYWMVKATIHDIDFEGVPFTLHHKRVSTNSKSARSHKEIMDNVKVIWDELKVYKENFKRKIPKQIFFFWGNEKMSWMRFMTLKSFRMMNPDWKMILYVSPSAVTNKQWKDEIHQDFFIYNGINYSEQIDELNIEIRKWDISDNTIIPNKNIENISPSHKSNFFKWCTLYEEGGIYSDLDIIYFKPIDDFYNHLINNNFDTAICETSYLSIGFLASAKHNTFYKDIFIGGFNSYTPNIYESAGIKNIYKLYNATIFKDNIIDMAKKKYPELNIYNIPFDIVYPLGCDKIEYAFSNDIKIIDLPSDTIGYHWYAGHPIAQKYNLLLDENNYKEHNILFTNIAKEILNK